MKDTTKAILAAFGRRGPALVKGHGNEAQRAFHANAVREERQRIGSKAIRLWLTRGV